MPQWRSVARSMAIGRGTAGECSNVCGVQCSNVCGVPTPEVGAADDPGIGHGCSRCVPGPATALEAACDAARGLAGGSSSGASERMTRRTAHRLMAPGPVAARGSLGRA